MKKTSFNHYHTSAIVFWLKILILSQNGVVHESNTNIKLGHVITRKVGYQGRLATPVEFLYPRGE